MKVLQVLTVLSANGEFGGPSTVASNQCAGLAERGHDVTLVAVSLGGAVAPPIRGVDVHTFPGRVIGGGSSFVRLVSPRMLVWIFRHAREYDVVHVHLGRDMVSMPAARLLGILGVRYVVQTHGMVQPRASLGHRLFDWLFTRPVLRGASTMFFLTDDEEAKLEVVTRGVGRFAHLVNGVAVTSVTSIREQGDPPEVLFLARLHPRKRPTVFASAAAELCVRHEARFTIAGPDEGEGASVDAIISGADSPSLPDGSARLDRQGPVSGDQVTQRVAAAAISVLPSVNEPLPMSVLEAMAAGVPVVITDSCGLADLVEEAEAGIVVDSQTASLVHAIDRLLSNPDYARSCGLRGRAAVAEQWSIDAVVDKLEARYQGLINSPATQPDNEDRRGIHDS